MLCLTDKEWRVFYATAKKFAALAEENIDRSPKELVVLYVEGRVPETQPTDWEVDLGDLTHIGRPFKNLRSASGVVEDWSASGSGELAFLAEAYVGYSSVGEDQRWQAKLMASRIRSGMSLDRAAEELSAASGSEVSGQTVGKVSPAHFLQSWERETKKLVKAIKIASSKHQNLSPEEVADFLAREGRATKQEYLDAWRSQRALQKKSLV